MQFSPSISTCGTEAILLPTLTKTAQAQVIKSLKNLHLNVHLTKNNSLLSLVS